ncbi:MAG: peptide/nickel transport system permease protein [Candidatus Latescibacterota bacterium]|jgi:peptide/nickel transport system permease protein
MKIYIIKRILALVPTLLGITVLVFLMVHLVPGDPAQVMLGERASAETLEALRQDLGLDQPLHVQFARYLGDLLQGDFGRSIKSRERISAELIARFPATLELALVSMVLACFIGLGAGIVSAIRRNTVWDYVGMTVSLAGVSLPIFWLGLMMIMVFSVWLGLFPVSGRLSSHVFVTSVTGLYLVDSLLAGDLFAFGDALWHLVLPGITLGTVPAAVIVRMTRSSLLEVLREDYVRTAWAKGLSERVVVLRHALRNAFIPILTVISLQFGYLLGGAVMTESIFAWPGLGRWLINAVYARDFPAIQGGVLLVAATFVIVNLVADLLYVWLDPRIKYDG